jgi:Flp pilus assembly protein TadD
VSGCVQDGKCARAGLTRLYLQAGRPLEALRAGSAWMLWAPALVAFLLYLPALQGGLVWDDSLFLNHPLYRDPAHWAQALSQPFLLSANYFRPLGMATFLLEGAAGGTPELRHLVNVLLHVLNSALVTLLVARLAAAGGDQLRARRAALAAGLLYGVHPALLEGVAFISSRFDLLVTAFLLLALLADQRLRGRRWLRPMVVGLAVFLAALSKEMAVAIIAVLPVWHLGVRAERTPEGAGSTEDRQTSTVSVYLAVGLGLVAYLGLRYAALGYLYLPTSGKHLTVGSPWQHVLLVGRSLAEYALLALWPFTTLRPIHFSELPLPAGDIGAWLALVGSGALVAGLIGWIRRDGTTGPFFAAAALALLPVLNVLPLELSGGAFAAERFLLFPLALLALSVGRLLGRGAGPGLWPLLALWLCAAVTVVQLTVPYWQSESALWEWGLRRSPGSPTPHTNLALVAINQGQPAEGLALANQALAIDPEASNAWNQRGLALIHLGRYAEAEAAFAQAIDVEPGNALYWSNLAGALREQGDLGHSERILLAEALRRDDALGMAHFNLGLVYLQGDRPDLAIPAFERAVGLLASEEAAQVEEFLAQSRDPIRWLRLGELLVAHGDPRGALVAFAQAQEMGAPSVDAAVGRSTALIVLQEWEDAEASLHAALLTAPQDARAYNNLGLIAEARGHTEDARRLFERSIALAPEWQTPQQNLERLGR